MPITYDFDRSKSTCHIRSPLMWLYCPPPGPEEGSQHIFSPAVSAAANIAMTPLRPPQLLNHAAYNTPLTGANSEHSVTGSTQHAPTETDICKIPNACTYFQSILQSPSECPNSQHLGYMKSHTNCRYSFYPPVIPRVPSAISSSEEVTSIVTLIERSQRGSSDLLHQYQLVLRISTSVLQFHGTVWLQPNWKLQNLSIFGSELSDQTLKTLYLSTHSNQMQ
ncbi:hypothetical protein K458DRAFT_402466 [Lentithecium fluviatile CBS 122367]|uniref:Uncharacterized protein n=1 Tax=Lentithecium fluviatile CBS 122367 TaxID=1168545 RepID=A0A6G1J8T9_9PLEO|nr:hypothetical protein K458DRAFT_402466 [Lentithecium fluviatile CBS 122367]